MPEPQQQVPQPTQHAASELSPSTAFPPADLFGSDAFPLEQQPFPPSQFAPPVAEGNNSCNSQQPSSLGPSVTETLFPPPPGNKTSSLLSQSTNNSSGVSGNLSNNPFSSVFVPNNTTLQSNNPFLSMISGNESSQGGGDVNVQLFPKPDATSPTESVSSVPSFPNLYPSGYDPNLFNPSKDVKPDNIEGTPVVTDLLNLSSPDPSQQPYTENKSKIMQMFSSDSSTGQSCRSPTSSQSGTNPFSSIPGVQGPPHLNNNSANWWSRDGSTSSVPAVPSTPFTSDHTKNTISQTGEQVSRNTLFNNN